MNIKFFGGANEIGASCTLIEIDENRILVDAGIRMNDEPGNEFPDFEGLWQAGLPHVVLLTHAHTDHTGALPELEKLLPPGVKVFCTAPTKDITQVLLKDVVKRSKPDEKDCIEARVSNALYRIHPKPFNKPIPICGDVTATWIRAGHILGAGMIHIQGEKESVLITGDVSAVKQSTILGMAAPPFSPDVMVMESTYGNRCRKNRDEESAKLAKNVAEVIERGGKALLPVFAVGRAQEVILILKNAMEREKIDFPVFVDGMVRDINTVYCEHSELLSSQLARDGDIFRSDNISEVSRDSSREERDSILSGEPCCIVASSGMLNGGMSSWYAKRLAKDPANLIGLTGYQAKGNPGHELESLINEKDPDKRVADENRVVYLPADEEKDGMQKDGDAPSLVPVKVSCEVKKYSLSAHADKKELLQLVEKCQPRKLFLVHGDEEARDELSQAVRKRCPFVDVQLPSNGTYPVEQFPGLNNGRRLAQGEVLLAVHNYLVARKLLAPISPRILAEVWFGTETTNGFEVDYFRIILSCPEGRRFFEKVGSGSMYKARIQRMSP